MTSANVDELIAAERKRAAERIAKIRRAAAAEQRKVNAKVVDLLREEHSDLYEDLTARARNALESDRAARSRRAKSSSTRVISNDAPTHRLPDEPLGEVEGSWSA